MAGIQKRPSGIRVRPNGTLRLAFNPGAPNAVDVGASAQVVIRTFTDESPAEVWVKNVATDLTIDKLKVVITADDSSTRAVIRFATYVPGVDSYNLGDAAEILLELLELSLIARVTPIEGDLEGRGVRGFHTVTTEEIDDATPFELLTPPEISEANEGEAFDVIAPTFVGEDDVGYTIVIGTAASASPEDEEITIVDTQVCPEVVGLNTYAGVGALFTGTGIDSENEGPYWSTFVEIVEIATETPVTVIFPPLVPTNILNIDGITNATFPQRSTISAPNGSLTATATVVQYVDNLNGSADLYLGDIANGPIPDNAVITGSGGGAARANGASETWQYKAGESFYVAPPVLAGDVTSGPTLTLRRSDVASSTGSVVVQLNNVLPDYYGLKFLEHSYDYTGFGITGTAIETTGYLPIGVPDLEALAVTSWFFDYELDAASGGSKLTKMMVRDDLFTEELRWTFSSAAKLEGVPFPGEREATIRGSTRIKSGVTYREYAVQPAVYNGKDYSIVNPDEDARRVNLGVIVKIGGEWTPIGERQTVPKIIVSTADTWFSRGINRTQLQAEQGIVGGDCMQFSRAWDSDGDYLIKGYDVTYPTETYDAGDNWQSEKMDGLFCAQSFEGILVDGDYVHMLVGALFMRQLNNSYRVSEGIYRKRRTTGKWVKTQALPDIYGTNTGNDFRVNLHRICMVPNSGSGYATRTLFAVYAPGTSADSVTSFQLYRANANGGDSWASYGPTLSIATYGVPREIWATSDSIYMATDIDVWRRDISPASSSWVRATGLPAGIAGHMEIRGTSIYALIRGTGLYKASTNDATPAFSAVRLGNYHWFSVYKGDTNRITCIGPTKEYTHNANAGSPTWAAVSNLEYPGQSESFKSALGGSPVWCHWHDTNPNIVYYMRFQHPGKSVDGGKTVTWSSNNEDYSEFRHMSNHRTDFRTMFFNMTDRLMTVSNWGQLFIQDDVITEANKDTIKSYINNPKALSARGGIVLDNGSTTGYVCHIGDNIQVKTPVWSSRTVSTTRISVDAAGTGSITASASADFPNGDYLFTCTTAAANGGTFTGKGPMNTDMGTWTVGTQKVYTHPYGGTLTVTINDGGTDFRAGTNPAQFRVRVRPLGTHTIMNPADKDQGFIGQVNPAFGNRGFSGLHQFTMAANGNITLTKTLAYPFAGYLGRGGTIILMYQGNSTLRRSTNEGDSSTQWATNLGNFNGRGTPIIKASSHNDQRAYVGTADGKVKKIQNGTVTTIFNFDTWCGEHNVTGGWPGLSGTNVNVPPVSGVVESWYNPDLLYVSMYLFGAPYMLFRTENALAANAGDVEWENITVDPSGRGIFHPIQAMFINTITDEPMCTSSHGNIWVKPKASHLTTYGITASVIDELRNSPGGDYHILQPL